MSEQRNDPWEARVQQLAGALPYPPTPDLAGLVRRRLETEPIRTGSRFLAPRLVGVVVLLLLILVGLLAVPQVRAALVEWLQLGAVRIFLVEPTPTATLTSPATSNVPPGPTATPVPSPTHLTSLLDLDGETTLAEARARVNFPIRLPIEPPELGPPDAVFLQDLDGPVVILVWFKPDNPRQVQLSLHLLGSGAMVQKGQPVVIEETTVKGQRALWVTGPYVLRNRRGDYDMQRLIKGHTLIWVEGTVTYRLETELPLDEAKHIAESLQ